MNLEGGIGGDFLKGGLTAGLAYYYSTKLTEDHLGKFPAQYRPGQGQRVRLGA